MLFSIDDSTPNQGLSATKQAPRELGGSQVFPQKRGVTRLSPRTPQPKQLSLWEPQQKPETEYPLKIEPLPSALQWWEEERFWLFHIQTGLRVPGTWSLEEAELIQDLSRQWDWRVDKDRRVACGLQLLALAEAVCKRSYRKGGECNA